jgi:acetolactate synthase-1/2/3 large subunit
MKETVSECIVNRLASFGTEYFFLLTGGDQPLWIALHDAGIKMVLTRSEFSAVYMADGYARASGRPGITYGQAGPGAANVAAALADPFWAQSPVVAITGATASGSMCKWEYQSIDQMPMFSTVTKWSSFAASPEQAPQLVSIALNQAMAGSHGPVHIDIPKDYFGRRIELSESEATGLKTATSPCTDSGEIREILDHFLEAEKPAILIGEGVIRADAESALLKFVEVLNVPVATTMGGKTGFPGDHPLNMGVIGRYSSKVANDLMGESDCIIAIGTRLGGLATNGYTIPNRKAKILQIDIDPNIFNVTYSAEIMLVSDARLALEMLLKEVGGRSLGFDASKWSNFVRKKIEGWRSEVQKVIKGSAHGSLLSPFEIIDVLSEYNCDITIVADTGYMAAWTGVLYPTVKPGSYFRAVGSLGWALPASLGVQIARPDKVICITGDGGFGYHLADIETAVRMQLPVVVVILNNGGLMFEYHEQKYRHQGRVISEANDLSDVDYGAVARALGARGMRVSTRPEFEESFKKALESDRPTVIDVVVDREVFPPVTNFEGHIERKL